MIANTAELEVAMRNLKILEDSLQALKLQLQTENPELLAVTSKSYANRISELQSEIAGYLFEHPSDVSLLLPPVAAANPHVH